MAVMRNLLAAYLVALVVPILVHSATLEVIACVEERWVNEKVLWDL